MIEILHFTRTRNRSGPGPSDLLQGTREAGWFGFYPGQLFTIEELYGELGVLGVFPRPANEDAVKWHKAIFQGRLIYFPDQSLGGVSWNTLYNHGLVFGVDGPGNYASGNTNQFRVISKVIDGKMCRFMVRLPQLTPLGGLTKFRAGGGYPENEVESVINKIYYGDNAWSGKQSIRYWTNAISESVPGSGIVSTSNGFSEAYPRVTSYDAWMPILELINPQDYFEPVDLDLVEINLLREVYPAISSEQLAVPLRLENISVETAPVGGVPTTFTADVDLYPIERLASDHDLKIVEFKVDEIDVLANIELYNYRIGIFDRVDVTIETV